MSWHLVTTARAEHVRDSPGTSIVGLIAAGALLRLALGRSKNGALVGATIGGIAALAGVGVANARTAPQVTEAATKILAATGPALSPSALKFGPASKGRRRRS
jgi:hypothetical protein